MFVTCDAEGLEYVSLLLSFWLHHVKLSVACIKQPIDLLKASNYNRVKKRVCYFAFEYIVQGNARVRRIPLQLIALLFFSLLRNLLLTA